MNLIKKIIHCFLNIIFILGWLCFYLKSAHSIIVYYIPGNLQAVSKSPDINFYVALLWQIVILFYYTKFFVAYFKRFFVEKICMKYKGIIIFKCVILMLLMGLTFFMLMVLSCVLGIDYIKDAFWYDNQLK